MSPKRLTQTAVIGLTFAAIAAPAPAAVQDLRSADARDAAPVTRPSHDLRSPDARSIGGTPETGPVGVDMRTPDSRDAGEGRGTFSAPDVMVVKLSEPAPAPVSTSDGLDWGDAGIGAGVLGALTALALGGTLVVVRRRGTATPA
jgi:hypothetical protein